MSGGAGAWDRSDGAGAWDRLNEAGLWDRSTRWRGGSRRVGSCCVLAVLLVLAGCGAEPELEGPAVRAAAQELWQGRCANCHGVDGRGDGPSGRALAQRPRDFHDAVWQASRDDGQLRRVIVEGGAEHGLSTDMAANADLAGRPAIVTELVRIVRGFGASP